jgi:hypothetical protein
MLPFSSLPESGLMWTQPKAHTRSFELRSGDKLIAQLDFDSAFGSRASAKTSTSGWTFKRTGFFSPKVTARIDGEAQDVAVYHPSFTGSHGSLDLASGERLQLKCVNFWSTEWAVADANDDTLLICHNRGVFSQGAELEICEQAQHRSDIPLLASLLWYVLILYMEDAAAV